ncbi:MAG: ATP-grasp domain-containing protein [Pseudomonadota bacterium]
MIKLNARDLAGSDTIITANDLLYVSSDTIYPIIKNKLSDDLKNNFEIFRNKYKFRSLIAHLFENFFFEEITIDKIHTITVPPGRKFILKPSSGFMGGANFVIDARTDKKKIAEEVEKELIDFNKMYPRAFSEKMILEDYIDGKDEYAVDMYYNTKGQAVILGIYVHPQAVNNKYVQLLYYFNKEIYQKLASELTRFFDTLNKELNIKNFPIHAEFKINHNGQFIPIEFNPCRFGGMGLVDLAYYGMGINFIKTYFEQQSVDWHQWTSENFYWLLGYNDKNERSPLFKPDHRLLKNVLSKGFDLLNYTEIDHTNFPVFSISYLKNNTIATIDSLLSIDFKEFNQKVQ